MRRVVVYKDFPATVVDYEGIFHGFSVDYEEFETGPGNYAVAIVERLNGKVETPSANNIQFVGDPI